MKKIILFVSCVLLFACNSKINCYGKIFDNYEFYVEYSINHMTHPVIITEIDMKIDKTNAIDTLYSITVKDSNNIIHYYDYNSEFIENIAKFHNVGDTIR